MCRLAAWTGKEVSIEQLISKPAHSLIDQSLASEKAKMTVNGDGHGFVWYTTSAQPGLYRDTLPAWGDDNLNSMAAVIKSKLILAHVRASTYGEVSRNNCHPFVYKNWSFMHNGQIAEFSRHRRTLEAQLSDKLFAARKGNTDSELIFLLLLQHGLEDDVHEACRSVLRIIGDTTQSSRAPNRISAVLSNGDDVFTLRASSDRKSPTLFIKSDPGKGVTVASEPMDSPREWQAIDEGSLLEIKPDQDCRPRIRAIKDLHYY